MGCVGEGGKVGKTGWIGEGQGRDNRKGVLKGLVVGKQHALCLVTAVCPIFSLNPFSLSM